MAKQQQVLLLEPSSELTFKGPFNEYVNANLTLSNPSPRDVYFKVKTTAPKFYCVRPNAGIIKAKDKAQINVMLQPVESPEVLESERSRHKFMIQSAFAPTEADESEPPPPVDQFWKSVDQTQVMDSKLRVLFQRPYGDEFVGRENFDSSTTSMASTATKGFYAAAKEQQASPTGRAPPGGIQEMADTHAALQKEIELRKMYQDEKANLEKENYALLERVEKLAQASGGGASAGGLMGGFGAGHGQENVPMLHAILFALLALLIGLVVGKLL